MTEDQVIAAIAGGATLTQTYRFRWTLDGKHVSNETIQPLIAPYGGKLELREGRWSVKPASSTISADEAERLADETAGVGVSRIDFVSAPDVFVVWLKDGRRITALRTKMSTPAYTLTDAH